MGFELWVMCGIILLCIVLSAFFSGAETALTALPAPACSPMSIMAISVPRSCSI